MTTARGHTWTIPARIDRVIDADTLAATLDLGWHTVAWTGRIRVAGINAPELSTPEGVAARDFVAALLPPGTAVTVTTKRLDDYGRPVCAVQLPVGSDLGQVLLDAGHAVVWPKVVALTIQPTEVL